MKRKRKYATGYGTGGDIGALAGTGAAMAIPGAQPLAPLLSGAGRLVGGMFDKEEEPEPPATVGRVFKSSYGFQTGGAMTDPTKPKRKRRMPVTKVSPREYARITGRPMPTVSSTGVTARRSSEMPAREPVRTSKMPARRPRRTSDMKARGPRRSSDFQEGGGIPSVRIDGRSHEAGGVNLEAMGRPDVEVERGESVMLGPNGQPEYVFSALRMTDKPRTFAEEFERLKEKGDLEGVKKLQMEQEKQMGRKKDVTMNPHIKKSHFAKHGGGLGIPHTAPDYDPIKAGAKRYGGRTKAWQYQTGGVANPWDPKPRTFYSGPGGTSTSIPPNNPRTFVGGPKGTGVSGLPARTPGTALQTINTRSVGSRLMNIAGRWAAPLGVGIPAGMALGEMVAGKDLGEVRSRKARNEELLDEATQNRIQSEQDLADLREQLGSRPDVENPVPEAEIIEETIDPGFNMGVAPGASPDVSVGEAEVGDVNLGTDLTEYATGELAGAGSDSPAVDPASPVPEAGPGGQGKSFGSKAFDVASELAPYAADLFNIGTAASMREPERPGRVTPIKMDDRISTVADEEALTRSARAIVGDPTASSNQKLAAISQLQQGKNQVRSQANRRRDAIRRGNVQTFNRAQEINQRTGERHADRLAQFRGAKASAISSGVRSIADRIAMRGYEKRAAEMEPMQLAALTYSLPTKQRRAFIDDMLSTLPAGHRLRSQFEALKEEN